VDKPSKRVAVVMQRRAIENRWQSEVWEAAGVLVNYPGTEPRPLFDSPALSQWLYPGFDVVLRRAEAEGYFHNVAATRPSVFVLWRAESGRAVPHYVTVSYDEASRWMDGGAQVDGVPMPADMAGWLRTYVEQNYRPEPKKRLRPKSFLAPHERGS
jgi:hypothetical protein